MIKLASRLWIWALLPPVFPLAARIESSGLALLFPLVCGATRLFSTLCGFWLFSELSRLRRLGLCERAVVEAELAVAEEVAEEDDEELAELPSASPPPP